MSEGYFDIEKLDSPSPEVLLRMLAKDVKHLGTAVEKLNDKFEQHDFEKRLMKLELYNENKEKEESKLREMMKEEQAKFNNQLKEVTQKNIRAYGYIITGISIGLNILFFIIKNFLDK